MRRIILTVSLSLIAVFITAEAAQREQFINVEGANLRSRIDAAIKMGRSRSQAAPFWVAYSFDVRPGVAVDAELKTFRGNTTDFAGTTISIGSSSGVAVETRNLGVFLLHDASGGSITRAEVYNLDRRREYTGYAVYWLGRASNEESLELLKGLAESHQSNRVAEHAVVAIGLHDDRRVPGVLKDLFRGQKGERVRSAAIFWLGQIGGDQEFLSGVVRDEQENTEVRKHAAFAIGVGKDATSLAALKGLYGSVTNRELKKHIIFAASLSQGQDDAVEFLIKVATSDPDPEQKKTALFWLGQKAGDRSLEVLGDVINGNNADTEVQEAAVFAISQRPKDQSVPLLINIAKTHRKAEIRRQAMFWLSQTGDQRAVDFFKEILSK